MSFPPQQSEPIGCKICGFTDPQNTRDCIAVGASVLGFNFWPKSKRYLAPESAGWLTELPERVVRVGVFVNASADEIADIYSRELIHIAQLHGDESPLFCAEVVSRGIPVIKALAVKDIDSLSQLDSFPTASGILLDAYLPGAYGGGGEPFDWALARQAVEQHPERAIILSGGLNLENAPLAIQRVGPAAIDVASGVEASPGIKDPLAVEKLLLSLKDAKPG